MLLREVTPPRSHWPLVGLVAASCALAVIHVALVFELMGGA